MDEDLANYGTPLPPLDEDTIHIAKAPRLSEQIVTDAKGRRRFHGAFTGGFSAGYFNSVGSEEGFTPKTFVSSRAKKAENVQRCDPTAFMDDEDLDGFGIASRKIQATSSYDDPRDSKTQNKRKLENFMGPIPGQPVLADLMKPVNLTVGMKFLVKLGWRPGQGIGPRVTKREKRKKKQISKSLYGRAVEERSSSSSDTEEESSIQATNFAPDDCHSVLSKPKDDVFGLGYSPLERTNVLGGSSTGFRPLTFMENRKRVAIKGHAFGVGAFEDEDEDIYSKEDLSTYDFTLGGPLPEGIKKKKASRWNSTVSLLGEVLDGFQISSVPLAKPKVHPLPELPRGFEPRHKSCRLRFERKENEFREKLSSDERRRIVAEPPSVEVRSGVKKTEPSTNVPSSISKDIPSFLATFRETSTSAKEHSVADVSVEVPTSGYKPFAAYPDKQKRFDAFVNAKGQGLNDIFPSTMTEWEVGREKEEFRRVQLFSKPLSSMMAARFTSATIQDPQNFDEGLTDMVKRDKKFISTENKLISEPDLDPDMKAAKSKMFGRATLSIVEWHPHKVLCKRFNVPNPFPDSTTVGTSKTRTEKPSIFSFLTAELFAPSHGRTPAVSMSRDQKANSDTDGVEMEASVVEEDYGLKVPVSEPPSMELFKAIFDDSSDSDADSDSEHQLQPNAEPEPNSEPLTHHESKLEPISRTSNTKPKIVEHRIESSGNLEKKIGKESDKNSGLGIDKNRDFSKDKICEFVRDKNNDLWKDKYSDFVKDKNSVLGKDKNSDFVKDKNSVLGKLSTKEAQGVFKGIDFEALNRYRSSMDSSSGNNNYSNNSDSALINDRNSNNYSNQVICDVANTKSPINSSSDSSSENEDYCPALPPHMVARGPTSASSTFPRSGSGISKPSIISSGICRPTDQNSGISRSTDLSSGFSGSYDQSSGISRQSDNEKERKRKHKKKHSHKHKKKKKSKKKESKRRS